MDSTGTVIELKENNIAVVKFVRTKACKNCNACISLSSGELVTEVNNALGAKVGDRVIIELHARSVTKAGLIMYGVPLLALISGAAVGNMISDLFTAILGVGAAVIAYIVIHAFEPIFERMTEFAPKMTKFVDEEDDENGEGE